MADDKNITQVNAASAVQATDLIPVAQGDARLKRATAQQVADFAAASGAFLRPGGTARTIQSKLLDEFHASDFGVSPSNTPATNTSGMQSAVNAVVAAGGGVIVMPRGLTPISHTTQINIPKLPSNQLLTIKGSGGRSGFVLSVADSVAPIYVGDPVVAAGGANVLFEDVFFVGTSQTIGRAVRAENANGLEFKGCYFFNLHMGVDAASSFLVQMIDCFSLNVGLGVFNSSTAAHGFRLIGGAHYNAGLGASGAAVRFEGARTDNVVIRDSCFEFCRQVASFSAGSSIFTCEGNYIEYCTVPAFNFSGVNDVVNINKNWIALAQGASSVGLDGVNITDGSISYNWFFGDASNRNAVQNVSPHILFEGNKFSGSAVNFSAQQTTVTSFLNGYTAGATAPGYRRQGSFVYLTGQLVPGTNGSPAFVLPVGFRPRQTQIFSVIGQTTTNTGRLTIDASNGNVVPNLTGGTQVNLDGIVISL